MAKKIGEGGCSSASDVSRRRRSLGLTSAVLFIAFGLGACSDESGPGGARGALSPEPGSDDSMAPGNSTAGDDQGSPPAAVEPSSSSDDGASAGDDGRAIESPDEMLDLDGSDPADGEGAGAPIDVVDEPADEASEEDAPPADDASPEEPAAFSPCPTDGSACRIMPLGDSITDGVGSSGGGYRVELFRQAVADGHAITFVGRQANGPGNVGGQPFPRNHEGYSGATIASGGNQIANRLDGALATNAPDIVLLQIGTNNIYQGMPPDLPNQLGDLIDRITDTVPDALVVVAQITPVAESGATFNFPGNGAEEYNATIPGVVQERVDAGEHLLLVDMFAALDGNGNFLRFLAEGLHPNDTGYAVMAGTWYEAIESFLP